MYRKGSTPSAAARRLPLANCLALACSLAGSAEGAQSGQPLPRAPIHGATPAQTTATSVYNCADAGLGSLRDAVTNATDGQSIDLTQLGCSTITLSGGEISTALNNLTINGPGRASLQIKNTSSANGRIFLHSGGGTLTVRGLDLVGGTSFSGSGGCISSSGNVVVDQSNIRNGFLFTVPGSVARGGGIYTLGNLTLLGSTVDSNGVQAANKTLGGGVFAHGQLIVRDSIISHNAAFASAGIGMGSGFGYGGGIAAEGNVEITRSTITGNYAGNSTFNWTGNVGGIDILGPFSSAVITNSTVSGNDATNAIGGVYSASTLHVANSTITLNTSKIGTYAAGMHVYFASADLQSTIIANNTFSGNLADLSGYSATITGTNNLIMGSSIAPSGTLTADPQLAGLANNGGPTPTTALIAGSPAIAQGNNKAGLVNDQRGPGFARTFIGKTDIGAFQSGDSIFNNGFEPPG